VSIQGQLQPLRNQEYEIKRKALDSLIEQKLLETEAKKNGLTTEKLLAQEVTSKIPAPSDAELEGYYFALKGRINRPFAEMKTQLRDSMIQAKTQQAREEYIAKLNANANVAVMLKAPRVEVAYDPARIRGNPKAPVMIVEFSDYQCPYCHSVEPTLKKVLAKYGDKVSLSYRDFPLSSIHPDADLAAVASRCALEQGKFWEYHDALFSASKLDKDSLVGYARELKLNDGQFSSCLSGDQYKVEIQKDVADGRKVGVNGTPGFFINGIELSGAKGDEAFTRIIDDELGRKASAKSLSVRVTRVDR